MPANVIHRGALFTRALSVIGSVGGCIGGSNCSGAIVGGCESLFIEALSLQLAYTSSQANWPCSAQGGLFYPIAVRIPNGNVTRLGGNRDNLSPLFCYDFCVSANPICGKRDLCQDFPLILSCLLRYAIFNYTLASRSLVRLLFKKEVRDIFSMQLR